MKKVIKYNYGCLNYSYLSFYVVLQKLKDFLTSWDVIRNSGLKNSYRMEFRFKPMPQLHLLLTLNKFGLQIQIHEDIIPHSFQKFTDRCNNILNEIQFLMEK